MVKIFVSNSSSCHQQRSRHSFLADRFMRLTEQQGIKRSGLGGPSGRGGARLPIRRRTAMGARAGFRSRVAAGFRAFPLMSLSEVEMKILFACRRNCGRALAAGNLVPAMAQATKPVKPGGAMKSNALWSSVPAPRRAAGSLHPTRSFAIIHGCDSI